MILKKGSVLLRLEMLNLGGKAVVDVGKICHGFQVRAA
jgi:hypothetical protein